MASSLDLGPLQSGSGLDLGSLQSISSNAINISQSENFSFTDSTVEVLGLLLNFSEAINLSDAVAIEFGNITASDQLVLSDSAVLVCNLFYVITDSISLSDLDAENAGIQVSESDQFTFTDSAIVGSFTVIGLTFNDSLTLSDTDRIFTSNPLNFSDTFNFNDSIRLGYIYFFGSISDELMLVDSVQLLLAPIANLLASDQLNLSDLVNVNNASIFTPINFTLSDSLLYSDSIGFNYTTKGVFEDSLMLSDTFTVVILTDFNPYLRRYLNDVVGQGNAA